MEVVKTNIKLPSLGNNQDTRLAFILDNVLTEDECLDLIKTTEDQGYEDVVENWRRNDVRDSQRCIIDSVEKAGWLWSHIKEYIPETWKEKKVAGLNERLRFLKYSSGQYFKLHKDGSYRRPDGSEQSFITIQLYLNEGFEGGNTTFLSRSGGQDVGVVPRTGRVLVFQHDILHEGSLLVQGTKYTMRTDIMYQIKPGKFSRVKAYGSGSGQVIPISRQFLRIQGHGSKDQTSASTQPVTRLKQDQNGKAVGRDVGKPFVPITSATGHIVQSSYANALKINLR